jgi:hypothetical protein
LARVESLAADVDAFISESWSMVADDEVIQAMRRLEVVRRSLDAWIDRKVVEAVDARNLAGKHLVRSAAAFLGGLLRLSPAEASRRVTHARALAPRVTITGQVLEAELPTAAAARMSGDLSDEHVAVISRTMNKLPKSLPVESHRWAETALVEQALTLDPVSLRYVGMRILDGLDPDGRLTDESDRRRRRFLSIRGMADGMYRLTGDLDPETGALAKAVLHSLAAPKAAVDKGSDGEPNSVDHAPASGPDGAPEHNSSGTARLGEDSRSAGQRLHDALRCILKKVMRAGELPMSGGLPATVLVTMTKEQYESGRGVARTSFGDPITVPYALALTDEALIGWVIHDDHGKILRYGETKRIATAHQTRALIARDKGCSFPGCAAPPEWTERHHVIPWRMGGATDVGNMCLLCDRHHDWIDTGGWRIAMTDGVPWFIPPVWFDITRTPRRNLRL